MKKILVIRFSSIGDIVLTTPVVRALKLQLNAEVHFLTKKGFASILQENPYIDQLHLLEDSLWEILPKLKQENFDIVIDLHHNLRTFLVKTFLQKEHYSFEKLNFKKWLLVNFKINQMPKIHIVDRYLKTVEKLGVKNDGLGLNYFLKTTDKIDLKISEPFIVWVIGAKFQTKQLPAEKIFEMLSQQQFQGKTIVLVGGKEDIHLGEKIMTSCASLNLTIINTVGQFSLNQSASIVQQSQLVLTNDTGFMHIAAAFKKPIISFWGNTVSALGMIPYYGVETIPQQLLSVEGLSCRPCSKIGFSKCPKRHFNCMQKQDFSKIKLADFEVLFSSF